jgi:hypothetical protein
LWEGSGNTPEWREEASATLSVGVEEIITMDRTVNLHIVTWDPQRVLAECEAKRQIVVAACGALRWVGEDGRVAERTGVYIDPDAVGGIEARAEVWGEVLDLLALPYADHPDYRRAWR